MLARTFILWLALIGVAAFMPVARAQITGDFDNDGDVDLDDFALFSICFTGPDGTPPAQCAPPVCGDGTTQVGEQCDDGGTVNGDGCSSTCLLEELCDGTDQDMDGLDFCDDPDCCAIAISPTVTCPITFTVTGHVVDGEALIPTGLAGALVTVQYTVNGTDFLDAGPTGITDVDGNYDLTVTMVPLDTLMVQVQISAVGFNVEYSTIFEPADCQQTIPVPDIIMFAP